MSNTSPDTRQPTPAIQRVQSNDDLTKKSCVGCGAVPRPIVWHADATTTFELEHKPGCPELNPKKAPDTRTDPAAQR